MPIHDWKCKLCGEEILDRYEPRVKPTIPNCPNKGLTFNKTPIVVGDDDHEMERLWSSAFSRSPFKEFVLDDGSVARSLADVRKHEAKTGVIARVFSQNPGNYRDNVYGEFKPTPFQTRNRRGVPYVVRKGRLNG